MPKKVIKKLSLSIFESKDFLFRELVPVVRQLLDAYNESTGSVSPIVSASETITKEYMVYPVDATSGPVTITLPSADKNVTPMSVVKIDSSGNAVTVSTNGSDTIKGSSTRTLSSQWDSVYLIPDEISSWYEV